MRQGIGRLWLKDGSLHCDGCPALFDLPGAPRVSVVAAARARGWHIYVGPSLTGKSLDSALCDDCVGTSTKHASKVERFSEEEPLF
jgi:hypothetical protein